MKSGIAFRLGGVALPVLLVVFSVCGFYMIPYDDCMDQDIVYGIRSDGKRIIQEELGVPWQKYPRTLATSNAPSSKGIDVEKVLLPNGNFSLIVKCQGKAHYLEDSQFDDATVAANGHVYYLENKRTKTINRSWLGEWSPEHGFQNLNVDGASQISLSVDQKHLVVTVSDGSEEHFAKIISLGDKSIRTIRLPKDKWDPIMLNDRDFLLFKHKEGHYGQIVQWTTGEVSIDGPKRDVWIDGGDIIDVAVLNDGQIWGIELRSGKVQLVRLKPPFEQIKQRLAWIESK
jgi:hypothetical protein